MEWLSQPDEQDAFFQPMASDERATLFEHCARAIDRSLALGRHGLPLIGGGDWNDGLNRVGAGGQGESIWLGWFLYATIANFVAFAERRGEHERAASWRQHAASLRDALEQDGWDGDWYRRGYFDDGTPLGSASSSECRIDSIAQSWGVISGAADPARAARAMAAVDENLILRDEGLALLFTPPFDQDPAGPRLHQGLSAREFARMAANIRMPRSGRFRHSPSLATVTRPPNCYRSSIRSTTLAHGPPLNATRWNLMWCARMSIPFRRTWGGAAGHGTRARPDGCIGQVSN